MQNSKIEWTHHTFNPWHGCQRVSPGCEHCYAETFSRRVGRNIWGPAKTTSRLLMSDNYWKQPAKWDKAAQAAGERHRVFCASMADVFEDHPQVEEARARLWSLVQQTPHLDWLLLTKRPENITRMVLPEWREIAPHNVWYGTSVEDQQRADERIPYLLRVPARVRFLSCEPLLGPVDLREHFGACYDCDAYAREHNEDFSPVYHDTPSIHWIICGGESGHGARPMHPDWARSLRDQCEEAGVAFHFKQWGEYAPRIVNPPVMAEAGLQFPAKEILTRVGKKAAGRLLDGQTWDEVPA